SRSSAKVESPRMLIRSMGSIWTAIFSFILKGPGLWRERGVSSEVDTGSRQDNASNEVFKRWRRMPLSDGAAGAAAQSGSRQIAAQIRHARDAPSATPARRR